MMTTIVIEHLLAKFCNDGRVGIAYVYLDYQVPQKSGDIQLSILKQLYHSQPVQSIDDLYKRHMAKKPKASASELHERKSGPATRLPLLSSSRPSPSEINNALRTIVLQFSSVFIVVDALDECRGPEGPEKLLEGLVGLQWVDGIKLFITSRPDPQILSMFRSCVRRDISAAEGDVLKYIDGRLPYMRYRLDDQQTLQESIRKTILSIVDGM